MSQRAARWSGIALVGWGNVLVLLSRAVGDDRREYVTLAGQLIAVTFVVGLLVGSRRYSAADLGFRPRRLRGPAAVLLAALAGVVATALVAIVVRAADCEADGGVTINVVRLLAGTALGEEILFRGALFAVWSRTTASNRRVVLANLALFALWHVAGAFKGGTFKPGDVLGPFVGGAFFLWARCRFSWIGAAAVLHATTNLPAWFLKYCR